MKKNKISLFSLLTLLTSVLVSCNTIDTQSSNEEHSTNVEESVSNNSSISETSSNDNSESSSDVGNKEEVNMTNVEKEYYGYSNSVFGWMFGKVRENETLDDTKYSNITQMFRMPTDEEGNAYIGTYSEGNGRIYKYDISSKTFIDYGKIDEVNNASYVRSLEYFDGYLYAGLGVAGEVYRINVETKEKENINN